MIEYVFFQWLGSSHGMTLTFLNTARTKSLEDPCLLIHSIYLFVMTNLVGGIIVGKRPQRKFFKMDFIGVFYLKMPMTSVKDIYVVHN